MAQRIGQPNGPVVTQTGAQPTTKAQSLVEARPVQLQPVFTSAQEAAKAAKITGSIERLGADAPQTQAGDPKLLAEMKKLISGARMGGAGAAPAPVSKPVLAALTVGESVAETDARFAKAMAKLPADLQQKIREGFEKGQQGADLYNVPREYSGHNIKHMVAANIERSLESGDPSGLNQLAEWMGTSGYGQSIANAFSFDTRSGENAAKAKVAQAAAGSTPAPTATPALAVVKTALPIPQSVMELGASAAEVDARFKKAMAMLPAPLQQAFTDSVKKAKEGYDLYAVPDDYAQRHIKSILSANIERSFDPNEPTKTQALDDLASWMSSGGFGQSVANAYTFDFYRIKELNDPDFARKQSAMRAGNAAQTRVLADEMGKKK